MYELAGMKMGRHMDTGKYFVREKTGEERLYSNPLMAWTDFIQRADMTVRRRMRLAVRDNALLRMEE